MLGRLLDWLFGKRYRKGWPRGVRPIYWELIEEFKRADPELWETDRGLTPGEYFRRFLERNPNHPWAVEATRPGSFFYLSDYQPPSVH